MDYRRNESDGIVLHSGRMCHLNFPSQLADIRPCVILLILMITLLN